MKKWIVISGVILTIINVMLLVFGIIIPDLLSSDKIPLFAIIFAITCIVFFCISAIFLSFHYKTQICNFLKNKGN